MRGRYELPRRWYRLKAQLLGVDRLADYDRMAAVTDEDESIPWADAQGDGARLVRRLLARAGRHARARSSTSSGSTRRCGPASAAARSAPTRCRARRPYVMLNYTSRRRDVLTLAHELGHGVHAALARPQGVFHFATPLTLAETASVFGETLVFGRLLEEAPTPASRLGLLAESIEGSIATVFRQVAMNRFEHLVHTARREQGELVARPDRRAAGPSRRRSCWATRSRSPTATGSWWSYVPHFINSPGYVYAYAYGQLLALAVYGALRGGGRGLRARLPRAARRRAARSRRRSSARSSASTSPTRASGTAGSISSSASSRRPSGRARRGAYLAGAA